MMTAVNDYPEPHPYLVHARRELMRGRIEGRIGQLLGDPVLGRPVNPPHEEGLRHIADQQRQDFRLLGRARRWAAERLPRPRGTDITERG